VKRREFITLLGGAAAWPFAARAQQPGRIRRIGVLIPFSENNASQSWLAAFRKKLDELGWQDGHSIQFDYRWAAGDAERMRVFAKELVELKPDLILVLTTPAAEAILRESNTIPMLFVQVSDPIGSGFVTSLNRPGGHVTGFMNMEPTMSGKWVTLLKDIAPSITRITLLFNPATAPYADQYLNPFKVAAVSLSVEATAAPVQQSSQLESIAAEQGRELNGGLIVMPDAFMWVHRADVISLAARYRLPAIYPLREFVELGGLLSYGNDRLDQYPRAAVYADRILKGEKPGELPVQAPVKFEMAINVKTAKALGLQVPDKLLALADKVIE
jgi:putative ABC transport system substrate-binding protein